MEKGTKIRLSVELNYDVRDPKVSEQLKGQVGFAGVGSISLQESITVLLNDGKPLVISQSADSISDRKVTVEVRATIVK